MIGLRCFLVLAVAVLAGCGRADREPPLRFVHASDPHLFEEPKEAEAGKDDERQKEAAVRRFKEDLNEKAFSGFLESLRGLAAGNAPPRFLVITGDFGIDPGWTKREPPRVSATKPAGTAMPKAEDPVEKLKHDRAGQVKKVADLLRSLQSSPVRDVYVVPGNNDIRDEQPADEALADTIRFFQDVQTELAGSDVTLHDLSTCYHPTTPSPAGCYADVAGMAVRLVGFPSYSFKNSTIPKARADEKLKTEKKETAEEKKKTPEDVFKDNTPLQERHMATFAALLADAHARGKKVLVLSHIPELDDPYRQAQGRFANVRPPLTGNPKRPEWSSWNVSPAVSQKWKEIVESPTVLGVLAGHFHDSHREIYHQPYPWSEPSPQRPDPRKLFLAPPLAMKNQDASPIQARGFALFTLTGSGLRQQFYWYDAKTTRFEPDTGPGRPERREGGREPRYRPGDFFLWVWDLAPDLKPLDRAAVVSIAFLLAFLTVARLWKIPWAATELTASPPEAQPAEAPATTRPAEPPKEETALTSNLGKTVLSGLGGLAVVTFLEPFWQGGGITAKAYYLVWFVVIFVALLVLSATVRGFLEALRSRIASEHRPPGDRP